MPEKQPVKVDAAKDIEKRAAEGDKKIKEIIRNTDTPQTKELRKKLDDTVKDTLAKLPKSPEDEAAQKVDELAQKAFDKLDKKNQDKVISDAEKEIARGEPKGEEITPAAPDTKPTKAVANRGGDAAAKEI